MLPNYSWSQPRCLAAFMVVDMACLFIGFYIFQAGLMSVTPVGLISVPRNTMKNVLGFSLESSENVYLGDMPDAGITAWNAAGDQTEILKHLALLHMVPGVNCAALFNDSQSDIEQAKRIAKNISSSINDSAYLELTADCRTFVTSRGYILSPLTKEEENFPLAFSILVFKETEMVERLLRAIYRPHNYYCIHVDKKSPDSFYQSISAVAKCFPNVFVASKRIEVWWGRFSVLEPEIMCMEELWRFPKWKYFFDLTGQEFPLKTNFELVKILTAYDGANDLEGTIRRVNKKRFRASPPLGIVPIKGSKLITVNRDFVDYILHNETAKALLHWAEKHTKFPDETFFATLNHNPQLGIRGAYKGVPETDAITKPFLTRFVNWGEYKCAAGVYVRTICILTLGDLPLLGKAKHYFANKFYLSQDRVVVGCLEEKIFNDTRDEYMGVKTFDTSYYANLSFVKNKV